MCKIWILLYNTCNGILSNRVNNLVQIPFSLVITRWRWGNLIHPILFWKNSSQKGIDFIEGVTILGHFLENLRLLWGRGGKRKRVTSFG